jgi:hypothetical protein
MFFRYMCRSLINPFTYTRFYFPREKYIKPAAQLEHPAPIQMAGLAQKYIRVGQEVQELYFCNQNEIGQLIEWDEDETGEGCWMEHTNLPVFSGKIKRTGQSLTVTWHNEHPMKAPIISIDGEQFTDFDSEFSPALMMHQWLIMILTARKCGSPSYKESTSVTVK